MSRSNAFLNAIPADVSINVALIFRRETGGDALRASPDRRSASVRKGDASNLTKTGRDNVDGKCTQRVNEEAQCGSPRLRALWERKFWNANLRLLIFAYFTEATWRMIECAPRLIGEGLGGCQLNTEI
jgi:hypothetical protein